MLPSTFHLLLPSSHHVTLSVLTCKSKGMPIQKPSHILLPLHLGLLSVIGMFYLLFFLFFLFPMCTFLSSLLSTCMWNCLSLNVHMPGLALSGKRYCFEVC